MHVRRGEEGRKINPGTAVPTKRRKYGGKFPYLPSFHFSSQVIEKSWTNLQLSIRTPPQLRISRCLSPRQLLLRISCRDWEKKWWKVCRKNFCQLDEKWTLEVVSFHHHSYSSTDGRDPSCCLHIQQGHASLVVALQATNTKWHEHTCVTFIRSRTHLPWAVNKL